MGSLLSKSASELRGISLVAVAIFTLVIYLSWWVAYGLAASPWHIATLMVALLYCITQLVGSWVLYLATHRSVKPQVQTEAGCLSVDVFVTANGETLDLIRNTLEAAKRMRGSKCVWLLDDASDPTLARLASHLGVGYLDREGQADAKAGNLNAALAKTDGDVVVVFDIDHVPCDNFLEETIGLFSDESVGFVQTMLTFSNETDGWIAAAASESSYDFYNPTSIGANGLGGATLIGSNALIRRKALQDIGGYRPGLAEDLATSIELHAAGWASAYVPKVMAPGIAPPDVDAWFTQQLKWARGVFELLISVYFQRFNTLDWGQRLSYLVRMTYYWIGIATVIHLAATIAVLFASSDAQQLFERYLLFSAPLVTMTLLIRILALRRWGHKSISRTPQLGAAMLVYATWPVYCVAWVMALLRLPLGFRPTPKQSAEKVNLLWLIPQLLTTTLIICGLLVHLSTTTRHFPLLYLASAIQAGLQVYFIWKVLRTRKKHAVKSA